MISITVKYGLTRELTTEVAEGTTFRSIIADPTVKAVLKHPENVSAIINGDRMDLDNEPADGDVIVLEVQAAEKAA